MYTITEGLFMTLTFATTLCGAAFKKILLQNKMKRKHSWPEETFGNLSDD